MGSDPFYEKAEQSALRFLLYRGRSVHELQVKLRDKGYGDDVIGKVVDRFSELKYLDDECFANQWARSLAVNKLWGNRKIEIDLRLKGISEMLIKGALMIAREEMSEEQAIRMLIGKKMNIATDFEYDSVAITTKEKQRLIRYLMGRGFSPGLIFDRVGMFKEENVNDRK